MTINKAKLRGIESFGMLCSDQELGTADTAEGLMELYFDGQFVFSRSTDTTLADLTDVNNWLGRSNWSGDGNFDGKFNEFRIYGWALTEGQILGNFLAGPDQLNNVIPEPSTFLIWSLGLLGVAWCGRRRRTGCAPPAAKDVRAPVPPEPSSV